MADTLQSGDSDQFIEEAASFDVQKQVVQRNFLVWGWRIAGVLLIANCVQALTTAYVVTRPAPPPGVVRVDNATGNVEFLPSVVDAKTTYGEILDKAKLAEYVRARESYSFETAGANYNLVGLMSSPAEKQLYYKTFDPRQNKQSPINTLGDAGRMDVKIKSRGFLPSEKGLVGVVRWSLETRRSPTEEATVTHWISTITYKYGPPPAKESDRDLNPLGWQAVNYRKDFDSGVDPTPGQIKKPEAPEAVDTGSAEKPGVLLFPGS